MAISSHIKKILTATLTVGLCLTTTAAIQNTSSFIHTPQVNASRRVRRHYARRHRARHYTRRRARRSHKAHRAKRTKRPKRTAKRAKRTRRVKSTKKAPRFNASRYTNDSFVVLRVNPNSASSKANLKNEIDKLSAKSITYGVYANDASAYGARQMMKIAPNASFYMNSEPSAKNDMNRRAKGFGKVIQNANKIGVMYIGNDSTGKKLTSNTRSPYRFGLISGHNFSGANVWQFNNSYWTKRVRKALIGKAFNNNMPIEFICGSNKAYPGSQNVKNALQMGYNGRTDDSARAAVSAAMQQWSHTYEREHPAMHSDKPTAHEMRVGALSSKSKYFHKYSKAVYNPVTHIKIKANHSHAIKGKPVKATIKRRNTGSVTKNFTRQQMANAYVSMAVHHDEGTRGAYAPEGCEAASMEMGLHLLGLNKHETYNQLLNKIPWTYRGKVRHAQPYNYGHEYKHYRRYFHNPRANAEEGYTNSPYETHTGSSWYPRALTKFAQDRGAKESFPLADAHNGGANHISQGSIKKYLTHGEPIVIEACHKMKHLYSGDHVILFWGYHNGQVYWADPNEPNVTIGHCSLKWAYRVVNTNVRGPRAVVLRIHK